MKMCLEVGRETFTHFLSLPAQELVNVRPACTDPSVTSATPASSTSAAPAVGPVSATTTPATATRRPVSRAPWPS